MKDFLSIGWRRSTSAFSCSTNPRISSGFGCTPRVACVGGIGDEAGLVVSGDGLSGPVMARWPLIRPRLRKRRGD